MAAMNPRRRAAATTFAAAFAAMLVATPALAHTDTAANGFAAGFAHPIGGLDHLLAMVAVGLWGAFLGRPLIVALPILFPFVMALGGVLGMAGVPAPPIEAGIALSVFALGLAIATALRAPVWAACLVVGGFALFHGYAHGQELPAAADPFGYSAGFVLATGLLHLAGIGIGLGTQRPTGRLAARALGGVIALAGVWFMVQAAGA